jgi:hypothetical protein
MKSYTGILPSDMEARLETLRKLCCKSNFWQDSKFLTLLKETKSICFVGFSKPCTRNATAVMAYRVAMHRQRHAAAKFLVQQASNSELKQSIVLQFQFMEVFEREHAVQVADQLGALLSRAFYVYDMENESLVSAAYDLSFRILVDDMLHTNTQPSSSLIRALVDLYFPIFNEVDAMILVSLREFLSPATLPLSRG